MNDAEEQDPSIAAIQLLIPMTSKFRGEPFARRAEAGTTEFVEACPT